MNNSNDTTHKRYRSELLVVPVALNEASVVAPAVTKGVSIILVSLLMMLLVYTSIF
jgi:hypothetical protein